MGLRTHWTHKMTWVRMSYPSDFPLCVLQPVTVTVFLFHSCPCQPCPRVSESSKSDNLCPRYRLSGKWHSHLWGRAVGLSLYLLLRCCCFPSEVFACSPNKGSQFSSSKEEGALCQPREFRKLLRGQDPLGSPAHVVSSLGPILSSQGSDFGKGDVSCQRVQAPL